MPSREPTKLPKPARDSTTTVTFTLANIIQFGIVIRVLTPPIICYSTCLISAMVGSTFLPCFLAIDRIVRSGTKTSHKIICILMTGCIPFIFSITARISLYYCFDENWYVWIIQGSTIPAMFWATYKMLFER